MSQGSRQIWITTVDTVGSCWSDFCDETERMEIIQSKSLLTRGSVCVHAGEGRVSILSMLTCHLYSANDWRRLPGWGIVSAEQISSGHRHVGQCDRGCETPCYVLFILPSGYTCQGNECYLRSKATLDGIICVDKYIKDSLILGAAFRTFARKQKH